MKHVSLCTHTCIVVLFFVALCVTCSDSGLEVQCYVFWAMFLQSLLNVTVWRNVLLEMFIFFVSPCTCSLYSVCRLCWVCSSTDWWRHWMLF